MLSQRLCLIFGVFLVTAAASADSNSPAPPYVRVATHQVQSGYGGDSYAVIGNRLYFVSGKQLEALSLPGLKKIWTSTAFKTFSLNLTAGDGSLFASTDANSGHSTIFCLDPSSGAIRWKKQRSGSGSPISTSNGVIYTSLSSKHLQAIDAKTRKTLWSSLLDPSDPEATTVYRLAVHAGFVVASGNNVTYCFDRKTGKQCWKERDPYSFESDYQFAGNGVWVPTSSGSRLRNLSNGQTIWENPTVGPGQRTASIGSLFATTNDGFLSVIDSTTGKELWQKQIGDSEKGPKGQVVSKQTRMQQPIAALTSGGPSNEQLLMRNFRRADAYLNVIGGKVFASSELKCIIFDQVGTVVRESPVYEELPEPIWSDSKTIICLSDGKLRQYVSGNYPAVPTDPATKKALAEKMIAHFEDLDMQEIFRLKQLGASAFQPLLSHFLADSEKLDRSGIGGSGNLSALTDSLFFSLSMATNPQETAQLFSALNHLKGKEPSAKAKLEELLATAGDPKLATPYFIKALDAKRTPQQEDFESTTYVARNYIVASKDPQASAYLLKKLKDSKSDPVLREAAYWYCAATGNSEAIAAVLAERHQRELVKPLAERFSESISGSLRDSLIAKKADASGQIWGLLTSYVLGSSGDLWLAKSVGGKWVQPRFIGVSLSGVSKWVKTPVAEPEFDGKTAKELASGAWFKALVGNPKLDEGIQNGGLTNIEKHRLSLNAETNDSDSDGDPDELDPWPNAPKRELSDAEKILEAAFEARYHFGYSSGTALFFADEGMKPFEMAGRTGQTIWVAAEGFKQWSLPLEQCYEQGVAFIRFTEWSGDETKPWEDRVIYWNNDHSEATVQISNYFGGLNGDGYQAQVRKFGDRWVVVGMRMTFVS